MAPMWNPSEFLSPHMRDYLIKEIEEKHGHVIDVNPKIQIQKYRTPKSEEKMIYSCEHIQYMEDAIKRAKNEITIVSPFRNESKEGANFLKKNGKWFEKISILYKEKKEENPNFVIKLAYNYDYSQQRSTKEELKSKKEELKKLVPFIDAAYLIKSGTHEKVLIIDKFKS